jgi:hypothetical protein
MMALLLASSNVFLINNIASIKLSDGTNLLGIRDLLMVALIGRSVLGRPSAIPRIGRSPYVILCKVFVALTCVAAGVGLLNGGKPLWVAREWITLFSWILPVVIAPILCHPRHLSKLILVVKLLGFFVSVGVFGETFVGMKIRFVTSSGVSEGVVRSTPSCWPLMMLSATVVMVELLGASRTSRAATAVNFVIWFTDIAASLLTQSRTLLVGLAAGAVVYVLAMALGGRRFRIGWTLLCVGLLPLTWMLVLVVGQSFVRNDFVRFYTARYSVLESVDSASDYSEIDGRKYEAQQAFEATLRSPFYGVGLGSPYRETSGRSFGAAEDPGIFVHNIYAYFGVKYGIPGLAVFVFFHWMILRSLIRSARDKSGMGPAGMILCVGLVNLLACASFGNVFGSTYMVQVAMVWLGGLVAYEALRGAPVRGLVLQRWPAR